MCFPGEEKMEQLKLEVEKPKEGALKYDYDGGLRPILVPSGV